jgi:hypothetical protein
MFQALKRRKVEAIILTPIVNSYFEKKLSLQGKLAHVIDHSTNFPAGIYLSNGSLSKTERELLVHSLKTFITSHEVKDVLGKYSPDLTYVKVSNPRHLISDVQERKPTNY